MLKAKLIYFVENKCKSLNITMQVVEFCNIWLTKVFRSLLVESPLTFSGVNNSTLIQEPSVVSFTSVLVEGESNMQVNNQEMKTGFTRRSFLKIIEKIQVKHTGSPDRSVLNINSSVLPLLMPTRQNSWWFQVQFSQTVQLRLFLTFHLHV